MKPDVKKIIADIKATKGNRKFCNGLAGTLQDDNYASSICKYVKTVTPERIDLLIEYAEKLETEVTDMAVQLANAESKCREMAAENAGMKEDVPLGAIENGRAFADRLEAYPFECEGGNLNMCSDWQELRRCFEHLSEWAMHSQPETPATDAFLAEVRAQGVEMLLDSLPPHYTARADIAEFAAKVRKGAAL
ncbi:hypothetical protein [Citrobacter portucalensis]